MKAPLSTEKKLKISEFIQPKQIFINTWIHSKRRQKYAMIDVNVCAAFMAFFYMHIFDYCKT